MSGKGGEDFVPIHSSGQRVSLPSPDVCLPLRARPSVFIQTVPLCTTTTKDLQCGCILQVKLKVAPSSKNKGEELSKLEQVSGAGTGSEG